MKEKFKLPRKKKKFLKKTIWLYPPDDKGDSLAAWPTIYEKDYTAYKKGLLRNLFHNKKRKEDIPQEELLIPDVFEDENFDDWTW